MSLGDEKNQVMSPQPQPGLRPDFCHHSTLGTRWMDNDVYGHVLPLAAAMGHFVHVDGDRDSRRPVALPATLLAALAPLRAPVA